MIRNQYQLQCSKPYQVIRILKLDILYNKNSLCVQLFVAKTDGLVQNAVVSSMSLSFSGNRQRNTFVK